MDTKRLKWIDMAKGLGMILVMLAHAPFPKTIVVWIYSFHMALFFFLSGYVLEISKYKSLQEILRQKVKRLIVPYLSFSLINYIYWVTIYNNYIYSFINPKSIDVLKPLIGTIYAIRGTQWMLHNNIFWFVCCLFLSELLLFVIIKYTENNYKRVTFSLIAISVVGYLYSVYIGKALLWSIDVVPIAVSFCGLGYFVKNKVINLKIKADIKYFLLFLIINITSTYLNYKFSGKRVGFCESQYGNYFLFYIAAISGIATILIFIKMLPSINALEYIGKNSMIFLTFHQLVVFPAIGKILFDNIYFFTRQTSLVLFLKGIIDLVIAYIIFIPLIYIINKYFPFMLGRRLPNKNSIKTNVMRQ